MSVAVISGMPRFVQPPNDSGSLPEDLSAKDAGKVSAEVADEKGVAELANKNYLNSREIIRVLMTQTFCTFRFLELKDWFSLKQVCSFFYSGINEHRYQDCFAKVGYNLVSPADDRGNNLRKFIKHICPPVSPQDLSDKQKALFVRHLFDERVYQRYLGKVEPMSEFAKKRFLEKFNEKDPFDADTTIGAKYVLMQIPEYIEISSETFCLDKEDVPNDPQAPRLIKRRSGVAAPSGSATLKVPVTLNNIITLFKHVSKVSSFSSDDIFIPYADTRISAGCVCMRRVPIAQGLDLETQESLLLLSGLQISELLPRVLFHFLEYARFPKTDVRAACTSDVFARTVLRDTGGGELWSLCKLAKSGLFVWSDNALALAKGKSKIGLAVQLPDRF